MRHRIVVLGLLVGLAFGVSASQLAAQTDLGEVDFPTSGPPEAQKHFVRGVLFLHSFEFADAGEAFRAAQQADDGFAMAYWGEAMSFNHPLWAEQDSVAARAAMKRLGATPEARAGKAPTERERDYLAAVEILYGEGAKYERDFAYAEAMRRLHQKYPDDNEAKAFYALAILGTAHEGRDHIIYMRAAALAEEVFRDNPEHPGAAHYLIHSYDDPVHAPLGLRAALAYSEVAPGASHAQHMTSHIFVALGMWDEVVSANETAVAVADRRRETKSLPLDARNLHALHWLAYGYLQQGRYEEARALLKTMALQAEEVGSRRSRTHLAMMRADYIVNTLRWDDPAVEIEVDVLDMSPGVATRDHFASGLAALERGDRVSAERSLAAMAEIRDDASRSSSYPPGLQAARVMELELQALLAGANGKTTVALDLMREAAVLEGEMPYEYGPPRIPKPSQELLGETLLATGAPDEALVAFEMALARAPNRPASLLGLAEAAEAVGDMGKAEEARETLRVVLHRADAEVLSRR
jgi:tetratricopeptide (TPR) repeat protein